MHLPSINSIIKWRVVARGGRTYPHLIEIFSWEAAYPLFLVFFSITDTMNRTSRIDKRQEGAVPTTIRNRDASSTLAKNQRIMMQELTHERTGNQHGTRTQASSRNSREPQARAARKFWQHDVRVWMSQDKFGSRAGRRSLVLGCSVRSVVVVSARVDMVLGPCRLSLQALRVNAPSRHRRSADHERMPCGRPTPLVGGFGVGDRGTRTIPYQRNCLKTDCLGTDSCT